MASAAPSNALERLRTEPLKGPSLAAVIAIVWIAGALYCSGYERLLWGLDNWPGSLVWSAAAVLPWLALFEWSKSEAGRRIADDAVKLGLALILTAAGSIALEVASDALSGSDSRSLALLLLRRLPAAGACLVLILWSRGSRARRRNGSETADDPSLTELAGSIDWIAAADNYIELHVGGRVTMRRMPLQEAERALRRHGFLRIHRRYLVNHRAVANVDQCGSGFEARMKDGTRLPCGKAFAASLHQLN